MFLVISCFKSESFIVINILTIFQNGIEYFLSTWFQQACVTPFVKKVLSSSLLRLNQKKVVSLTLFRGDNFNFDSNQIKGSCAAVVRETAVTRAVIKPLYLSSKTKADVVAAKINTTLAIVINHSILTESINSLALYEAPLGPKNKL